jgi:AAA domain, putative AbiEii toxin, Type IV TA system
MYFSADLIISALAKIKTVHPFHGITFLACKRAGLAVGSATKIQLDSVTKEFMNRHHKLSPESKHYFQPFKSNSTWLRSDYPSSGLQAVNTQTFRDAFIHTPKTDEWGWSSDYVTVLRVKLPQKKLIPAFSLVVWLYRDKGWPDNYGPENMIDRLITDFSLTPAELDVLFDLSVPNRNILNQNMQIGPPEITEILRTLPPAPDAPPEQDGTLAYLEIMDLGPAKRLILEPSERLTLITGDNGLGKTFLLECAWWALTGTWADKPALPNLSPDTNRKPKISFGIQGEHNIERRTVVSYNQRNFRWPIPKDRPTIPGLTVFARVDGSFAVWDPNIYDLAYSKSYAERPTVFTSKEVWDGLTGHIEGLIRDWVKWQSDPEKYPFEIFKKILAQLSPPDMGVLIPGPPVRIPGDPREIPTIEHPYGSTPLTHASAGIRRVVALAYLIVWSWTEHKTACKQRGEKPRKRLVILVDEMEAHLHPRWQRSVLPALLSVTDFLSNDLATQMIVATHSPLVMASSESVFDQAKDCLYHLDLSDNGVVSLQELQFAKFGDISSWLTSPVFKMKHARSNEAEAAIEMAKKLQQDEKPSSEKVGEVTSMLIKYLAEDDKFWPRWIVFAERFGVEL